MVPVTIDLPGHGLRTKSPLVLARQPIWTPEYERFVRELVPDLDYQMWEGVSHFILMEKPNESNAALAAFLEKHCSRRISVGACPRGAIRAAADDGRAMRAVFS